MRPLPYTLAALGTLVLLDAPAFAQDLRRPDEPTSAPAPAAPVLTKPPKIKTAPQPVYPPDALAAQLSADVTLQIDIDAAGNVTDAKVRTPVGNGFDEAAVAAARAMTFEPAEIDGKPGAIRIEYTMRFRPAIPVPAAPETPPAPAAAPAVAKEELVRGRLRERGTRDPVVGADVVVTVIGAPDDAPPDATAITLEDGTFTLAVTPGIAIKIVASSGEHDPCIRDVTTPAPGAAPLEVSCVVARRGGPRYESVTEAPPDRQQVTRHSVSQAELRTVPGTFGDPLRVIQNLPGVARSPYGIGLLVIRGSSPNDSGVYVDGHQVPLLYHFLGGPSVLTPPLIGRIDFYPGGFGVRYGRATAGVIDVATRADPVSRVHGEANINIADSSVYVEGPLADQTTGGLAARRSYVDTWLPLLLESQQGSSTAVVTPVYWDYQARVTRTTARLGRFSLFGFGSKDSLEVFTSDPDQGDVEVGTSIAFHRIIGTWTLPLGPATSVFSPSYGYDTFGFSAGEVSASAGVHNIGLREDLTIPVARTLKLTTGIDALLRFNKFAFDVPLPAERRSYGRTARSQTVIERNVNDAAGAVYLEALWDVHPKLRIAPGLRFDQFHYNEEDRLSLDPRFVMRWAPRSNQAFKLGAGIFHQPPEPAELDAQFGNPDLRLIWSDQYHVGYEQGLTRLLSLDATLYYLRRHRLPIASNRQVGMGRSEGYASDGKGRSYGLEFRLRHAVTDKFFGWISYTLSRSEAILVVPVEEAPEPPYRPTEFDQTHNLIVVASRRVGRGWELGARFRLVSGIPETRVLGATYDSDYDDWSPVTGPRNADRRQTFHQLDLRAEYTFTFDVWRFSAYVDLQNAYNAENPEATIYDYRFREKAPVRGLPIFPVFGLRGQF